MVLGCNIQATPVKPLDTPALAVMPMPCSTQYTEWHIAHATPDARIRRHGVNPTYPTPYCDGITLALLMVRQVQVINTMFSSESTVLAPTAPA